MDEIDANNAIFYFSQAYVLKSEALKKNLEQHIIKKVLKPDNSTKFYFESIKFKIPNLQKACEDLIVKNFPSIVEKGSEFIKELPVD